LDALKNARSAEHTLALVDAIDLNQSVAALGATFTADGAMNVGRASRFCDVVVEEVINGGGVGVIGHSEVCRWV
jgi:hypothetical protein